MKERRKCELRHEDKICGRPKKRKRQREEKEVTENGRRKEEKS